MGIVVPTYRSMDLADISQEPDSVTFEDGEGPRGDIDTITFDVDLVNNESVTITGNFEGYDPDQLEDPAFPVDGYSWSDLDPIVGTFSIDNATGEFTYTVSRDDISGAGQVSDQITVFGGDFVDDGPAGELESFRDEDEITFNITVCFGRGTRIAVPDGTGGVRERRVEDLAEGDLVLTADGRAVPVLWMGINAISPMFRPADRLEPVLIRAGALEPVLGAFLPARDLVVTADHGMVIPGPNGEMVVNASALVGAPGIEFLDWRRLGAEFCYYHIETENHETVLAEGTPAETYIDYVGRRSFDNYADYEVRFGDERIIAEMPAPRVSSARLLPARVRTTLGIAEDRTAEAMLDEAFEARAA